MRHTPSVFRNRKQLPGAMFNVASVTARRVAAMDGGHKKLSGTIFNVAPVTARRVATTDGGHKKSAQERLADIAERS
ncbi:hypothetical protein [Alloalcanivorax xenomutans]|jgi:hypothetical protein|uniref:hypothetical protein n=1 Tax=Alloalcanivorax xenomutans TaxID=1094342 RepID=UPI0011C07A94